MTMNPDQTLFQLTHTATFIRSGAVVCIPDRDSAECEITRLKREHGTGLIKATIRKDRPPKRNPQAVRYYTVNYTVRETRTVRLF